MSRILRSATLSLLLLAGFLPVAAHAAHVPVTWFNQSGTSYIQQTFDIFLSGSSHYINFNAVTGSSGYGIRDNAGTIECKNSGGSWSACQDGNSGGGGGSWPFATGFLNFGVPVQATTTPEWFQNGVMASSTSQFVYASTTQLSATSLCLNGDTCRTTWPTSGSSASSTLLGDSNTFTGLNVFGNTGGVYVASAGSGVGGIGFNSTPDGGYVAGVAGYGALMQLAPSTGVFTMFAEGNAAAGAGHTHVQTMSWDGAGNVFFPQGFVSNASTTIGTLHLVNQLYGNGTAGQVLEWSNGAPSWVATSSDPTMLTLATWYATTSNSKLSSLPALSITKSQVSDFGTYQVPFGPTTTNPFLATTLVATSSGSVGAPAVGVTDAGGIYRVGANSLGLTNGVSGLTWNGTAFMPNTTAVRDLGGSSNVWNRIYFTSASTTNLTVSNVLYVPQTSGLLFAGLDNQVRSQSTSTLTATAPLTGSFIQDGTGGALGCTVATALVPGCLAAADFTTFAGKITMGAIFNTTPTLAAQPTISTSTTLLLTNNTLSLAATSTFFTFASTTALTVLGGSSVQTPSLSVLGANVGISTTTPWAKLAISTLVTDAATQYAFLISSSSAATTTLFFIDRNGHMGANGGTPALSSCGTSPRFVSGGDTAGIFFVGTGSTNACTLTFGVPFTKTPYCFVNLNTNSGTSTTITASSTLTTLLIGASTTNAKPSAGGAYINYFCISN